MTINAGNIEIIIKADTDQLLVSNKQVDKSLSDLDSSFEKTSRSVDKTEKAMFSLSKTAALVASALSVGAVVNAVDEWGQMAARIKMALNSVEGDISRYSELQNRFLEVSNRNGKAIETVQALYAGSATSMKELGYNTTQTMDYIESLSSAFTANATGAQQTESAMNALNRAMVVGVLRGNDWHSVLNATPSVVGDIAKELSRLRGGVKVTENDVKKMAMETGISMKLFVDSTTAAKNANNALADSMDNTVQDGFTKLTNSAKAYYGELNQTLGITRSVSAGFAVLTENFDYLAKAITAIVAVGAARYFGNLSTQIVKFGADSAKAAIDSKRLAVEKLNTAKATLQQIQAERAAITANQQSLNSQLSVAKTEKGRTAIKEKLAAATAEMAALNRAEAAATDQLTAAQARLNTAARALTGSMNLLKSGLSFIGGPAGAAMIAAGAIYYFWNQAEQAKEKALAFSDSIKELRDSFNEMSVAAIRGNLADAQDSIKAQQKEIGILKADLMGLRDAYKIVSGDGDRLAEVQRKIDQKTKELEESTKRLEETMKFASDAQSLLNTKVNSAEEAFQTAAKSTRNYANALGVAIGYMNAAAEAKANLNEENAKEVRSDDGDKYIQQLKDQNELLNIQDKRARAVAAEKQRQLKAGTAADSEQMKEALALAGANYDLSEAEKSRAKSTKESTKSTDEAKDSLQRLQERLDRLSKGYKDNSLEMAKYDAVQSLGAKAAPEQIALAEKKAEAIWKMEEAVRNLAQAEQGRKYANQEIAAAKVAENPYTDTAEDPLAQINLQEQQKLEALEKYRLIDTENAQLYEDAKTAIMQQAAYEREDLLKKEQEEYQNNMLSLLGSTSEFASSLAGAFGDAVGESNAAYKALFAVSKAFAIAQASLNLQTAIGNALAIPWPKNIPAIAQAMAAGSQLVNAVRGVNYGGRRYGGNVSGGNPYRINESGESEIFQTYDGKQAFIPNKSGKVVPADKASNGAANISVTIIHTGQPFSVEDQRVKQGNDGQMMLELITRSIDEGSTVSQAIERNFNTNRRARGGY
ncbi:tape measure protein [Providencia rettgeri]|uniref:tape measure protein n=1 Tax=Providencia rettgeri TaxID=587 RepID=UPI0015D577AD|nr:tape measure protein [Providencia rettgeri]